ncbi:MAG TPA: FAD-dependent oxidoreductase [Candidatus Sulfotelmatobacter sp.]|nr:FAD-dependent oxidoreductase [Candidatus Sulfotelmatobacter sp.]
MPTRRSLWLATAPHAPQAPLSGRVEVDVAVVGGGITGITTAFLLKQSGRRVALVEARELASGTTGNTTAKVTALHGLVYQQLVSTFGEARARLYADANSWAVQHIAEQVERLSIDCDLQRLPAYTYTQSDASVSAIEKEVEVGRTLGLDVHFDERCPLPVDVRAAVRLDDQVLFHPRKYCLSLASAIPGDGSHVFENSRVTTVHEGDRCTVLTSSGEIEADHVVIATLLPFADTGDFHAKTHPSRSYAFAVRVSGDPPPGMFLSVDTPIRSLRPHRFGDETFVVIEGDEHPTGKEPDTESHYGAVEEWWRRYLDITSIDYRWSAQDYMTMDGAPFVGRARPGSDRVLVATGFNKWGMSNGTAGARMLADLVLGHDNPWLTLFDASRVPEKGLPGKLFGFNVDVAARVVAERLPALSRASLGDLDRDQAAIVSHRGAKVAAYRDTEGRLHAVSPECTHMGCGVAWNNAEGTWDCPCHGSRFDVDGRVIEGPAVRDLESVSIDSPR